jgi:hypothetical protein
MRDRTPRRRPEPPRRHPRRDPHQPVRPEPGAEASPASDHPEPDRGPSSSSEPSAVPEYTGSNTDTAMAIAWTVVVAAVLAFAVYNIAQRL